MSGLIYVPSTDIDDGGKTRIGGHFFRKEFLPDASSIYEKGMMLKK
jgi:hypothetical protein